MDSYLDKCKLKLAQKIDEMNRAIITKEVKVTDSIILLPGPGVFLGKF